MYVVRRVAKTKPGKEWAVATQLTKICDAYENENGRNKAIVYISGRGLPGEPNTVYAEWTQPHIEPTPFSDVPESVWKNNAIMRDMITDYTIEFYEVATPERLKDVADNLKA